MIKQIEQPFRDRVYKRMSLTQRAHATIINQILLQPYKKLRDSTEQERNFQYR